MKRLILLFAVSLIFVSCFSDVFAAGQIYKKKVFDSFTVSLNTGSLSYQEAPLKGGTAILVGGNAAYWMKAGRLYAANGVAMTWSSKLETTYEPGIDYDTIKAAISGTSQSKTPKVAPVTPSVNKTSFTPTGKSMCGTWYIVATNPSFVGDIITDYLSYKFLENGTVVKTSKTNQGTSIEKGTYKFNAVKKQYETRFDFGSAGVQVLYWEQESSGIARTVYWRNITEKLDHSENDEFVKQGDPEWNNRNKRTVN